MDKGTRVASTTRTRGMQLGAVGAVTMLETDEDGDWVLIEWDEVVSGPIWHRNYEVKEVK